MFLSGKRPPTVTRKVVVQVKKSGDGASRASTPSTPKDSASSGRASSKHSLKPKNKPLASVHRASVPRASSTDSSRDSAPPPAKRPQKRKAPPPPTSAPFSSDSDSDSDGSDGSGLGLDLLARKKPRPSPGLAAQDVQRNMFRLDKEPPTPEEIKACRYRGSAGLTGGAKGYRAVFTVDGRPATVKLRYPGHYPRERYVSRAFWATMLTGPQV
jgi:hypothetical protein